MTTVAPTSTQDRYLNGDYLALNGCWHEDDAPWKVDHILLRLKAAGLSPATICEVGCGSGRVVELLADAFPGARAEGFDISPQASAINAARARPGLSFTLGNAFESGRRYDLAMAIDVIEHVEDPFAFARSLGAMSRYQMLHIPLDMNALSVARGWPVMAARSDIGHIHYFTRDTAIALLKDAGLEPIGEHYTPWAIDQSHKSWKKRLAAVPRRLAYSVAPHAVVRAIGGWSLMVLCRSAGAEASA